MNSFNVDNDECQTDNKRIVYRHNGEVIRVFFLKSAVVNK